MFNGICCWKILSENSLRVADPIEQIGLGLTTFSHFKTSIYLFIYLFLFIFNIDSNHNQVHISN